MAAENSEPALPSTVPGEATAAEAASIRGQPVLDAFYEAVVACGRKPPFKPTIRVATIAGPIRYDHVNRSVVLVPYEALPATRRTGMDRFAAIGTLGLSGREQYMEVFNSLLVAHELGHWLQEIARRPLNRWQAEYSANRIMVAFWRDHPAPSPAAPTENRLANFVSQAPNTPSPMPENTGLSVEHYFNTHLDEIESNPMTYAAFQKMMVREAIAEKPFPSFCQVVHAAWPI